MPNVEIEQDDEDTPRRRRTRARDRDDDDDDFAERGRSRKRPCANCGSTDVSLKKRVHIGGWLIMGVSLFMGLFFFIMGFFTCVTFFLSPLCLLGLLGLMWTEDRLVCYPMFDIEPQIFPAAPVRTA